MIKTEKIAGAMAEHKMTGKEMAQQLNMTSKTFYSKMKKGVFGSDEIEAMIRILDIKDPVAIFFAKE